jgi:6-phosphogluconolactonase
VIRPERIVVDDAARLADAAAEWIAAIVESATRHRGHCTVALAGGTTPRPIYERLARDPLAARIAWRDVEIYFGDERAVPAADAASNYRMAAETLLARVPVPPGRIHRMPAERPDRDEAAQEYDRILPLHLDLLLLGMGADGHTASLFPGSPALEETARRVVAVSGPTVPRERLTITPPVIVSARRVAVLVAGREKAAAVARALQGPARPQQVPVQLALRGVWFVDRDAAAQLPVAAA